MLDGDLSGLLTAGCHLTLLGTLASVSLPGGLLTTDGQARQRVSDSAGLGQGLRFSFHQAMDHTLRKKGPRPSGSLMSILGHSIRTEFYSLTALEARVQNQVLPPGEEQSLPLSQLLLLPAFLGL